MRNKMLLMNHRIKWVMISILLLGLSGDISVQAFQIIHMPEELTLQAKSFPLHWRNACTRKTNNTLRDEIALELGRNFNDPQVDIKISFNSQSLSSWRSNKTAKIQITDIPLSLADALGQASGINTNTGEGGEVYIRQATNSGPRVIKQIFHLKRLSFRLVFCSNDIVYVNAKGTTRWNRVISQFFPFSTFLNSIDNLVENN